MVSSSLLRGYLVDDKGEITNYEVVAMIAVSGLLRFESALVATVLPGWRALDRVRQLACC